jgi:hypothetical protein
MRLRAVAFSAVLCASLAGCSDKTPGEPSPSNPPFDSSSPSAISGSGGSFGKPSRPITSPGDFNPDVRSPVAPAPIQGGTLLVTRDGAHAISSDPDRDRVMIVDLLGAQVLATIALEQGDEPGRLVEDAAHRVHVVLRRSGQIAAIDVEAKRILGRRNVCSAPQGIAYASAGDELHVACADGQLVSLPAEGGEPTRRVVVDADLRDVIVSGDRLFVTRFKTAELLELDADGAVASRQRPPMTKGPFLSPSLGILSSDVKSFEPVVAWRTVQAPDGRFAIVHQRAQLDEIALHGAMAMGAGVAVPGGTAGRAAAGGARAGSGGIGGPNPAGDSIAPPGGSFEGGSAYGSGIGCDGIVPAGVTFVEGQTQTSGPVVPGLVLPVDAAISPDNRWLAIASAGSFQSRTGNSETFSAVVMPMGLTPKPDDAPFEMLAGGDDGGVDPATAPDQGSDPFGGGSCLMPGRDAPGNQLQIGQVVAVAFDPSGHLVAQTRDPNRIVVLDLGTGSSNCLGCEAPVAAIDLGGAPRRDSGHDLFHLNAGGGLACASCHPGGGDDGHTWSFAGIGARRTQLFNMGIRDTTPLHWNGEFSNLNELLLDVFVSRMGGMHVSLSEGEAIADYMESLHPNAPMRDPKDQAAVRGKALFESAEVECATCHNGPKLTNNQTVDVGTGALFQVPSLIGVAYHQPFMHNGCAQTLRDRFDPSCGGSLHGKTAQLDSDQIDDLIAYLQSL